MQLETLKMYNFRLFTNFKIEFNKGLNIITGLNATGKTSVLEAIHYLSVTKSFRDVNDADVTTVGQKEFAVIGEVKSEDERKIIRVCRTETGKSVFKNDNRFKRISNYLGELLTVSFSNSDILRLVGTARDRRKIFEPIICQISNEYVEECNYYKKILNERNALLKRLIFEKKESLYKLLDVVDNQLVISAKKIISIRRKFVIDLNLRLNPIHSKICSCSETICVKYLPSVHEDYMLDYLKKNIDNDIKKGSTCFGPHRDDYGFYINEKNVVTQGSQGQQRNSLITIKIAFVEMIKKIKKEDPILLLDDVFSELDKVRQNNLLEAICDNVQTILSSATLAEIDENLLKHALVITLKKEENANG